MKLSNIIIILLIGLLFLIDQSYGRRLIWKRSLKKGVATGNIITAPNACPPNHKIDNHNRCRKVRIKYCKLVFFFNLIECVYQN